MYLSKLAPAIHAALTAAARGIGIVLFPVDAARVRLSLRRIPARPFPPEHVLRYRGWVYFRGPLAIFHCTAPGGLGSSLDAIWPTLARLRSISLSV